ncbi:hypothetical protein EJ377_10605 [Chryseobacterium arthrosphaerae]|uniref:Tetratricopeptide repeat protein n=1 Tax=Chryseobacterium arthrosphaerae TaxID=651561 RepID=A0A3S0N5W5_9FLAO|nr:hypothetical protein EJ377_10605 [Chryseobacterium arthrosphaerae]
MNPNSAHIYYNWAKGLDSLHEIIKDKQILFESVSMYKKAREIDPKNINILNNLGIAIRELAIYGNEENIL